MISPSNPFSTRWTCPGAIPYRFPPGDSAAALVDRLRRAGWRGAIVGPHGSGKSTLLEAIEPEIASAGRVSLRITLHDGRRRLPRPDRALLRDRGPAPALVVVDGYEQLGPWARLGLRALCARRGLGLLATGHAPVGLPIVARTAVDPATAVEVVALLARSHPSVDPERVLPFLERHGGNLREALFDLYDWYEETTCHGDHRVHREEERNPPGGKTSP